MRIGHSTEPVLLERPAAVCLYGNKFRTALQEPLSATWSNVEPRALLRRLGDDRKLAILLDRRIDPTTPVQLTLTNEPVTAGLERLATVLSAAVSLPENVIYLGPPETARWLRTTIEHHDRTLTDPAAKIPERRRLELSARHTLHWQDLDTPQDVLRQIAERHHFTFENLNTVPYDLWAGNTLPQLTAAEALTLVLIQFDLDWEWKAGGTVVEIVPFREPPLLERRYKPRGKQTATQLHADWTAAEPDLILRVEKTEVVVAGRVEDHDRLQARLAGKFTDRTPAANEPTPLRRRLFTLRVENVPVAAIMQKLEESGVKFAYDAAKLQAAGVDLSRTVTIDAQKATADEFLQKLFGQFPLKIEIEDREVRLVVVEG